MRVDRRRFLSAASLFAASPLLFARAATEQRFIFVIQRGAADGLDTVIPYADPDYARARGALAVDTHSALKLDGMFALHPSLSRLRDLYASRQATCFQAVASPYRDRSHFDGQNVLETGGAAPFQVKDGWMNRLVGLLAAPSGREAIAFTPSLPLAMRGPAEVTTYAPSALPQAGDDLLLRVEQLYAADTQLQPIWASAMEARAMTTGGMGGAAGRQDSAALGRMAAGFLARPDGPRIAMIETQGWDTHSGQTARLATQLKQLDGLIGGLQDGLGGVWSRTVILVATEFGRTVAANGTGGTDHGTGAAALLIGGAVQGGRVVADWPGLRPADLHEGRDLRPTLALDALTASACAQAFGLDHERTAHALFPGRRPVAALDALLRS